MRQPLQGSALRLALPIKPPLAGTTFSRACFSANQRPMSSANIRPITCCATLASWKGALPVSRAADTGFQTGANSSADDRKAARLQAATIFVQTVDETVAAAAQMGA